MSTDSSQQSPAESVQNLRQAAESNGLAADVAMYEKWAGEEQWPVASVAVPLIAGVDPDGWTRVGEITGQTEVQAQLTAQIAQAAGVAADAGIPLNAVRQVARTLSIPLAGELEGLLDYLARVLPPSVGGTDTSGVGADIQSELAEREVILGAALFLVTRFADACRDDHGFFDGGKIADQMIKKAAIWFPLGPPALSRDDIAALIEKYLT